MVTPAYQNHRVGLPSHYPPYNDWIIKSDLLNVPHAGVGQSFNFIASTPKYVEAYNAQTGPGWGEFVTYLNYNHGNQPYKPDGQGLNTARSTPALPNWYALSKVSPKMSAPGVQLAQQQLGQMLSAKTPIGQFAGNPFAPWTPF